MLTLENGTLILDTTKAKKDSIAVYCHATEVGYQDWYLDLTVESQVNPFDLMLAGASVAPITIILPDGSTVTGKADVSSCSSNGQKLAGRLKLLELSEADRDALKKSFHYKISASDQGKSFRSKDTYTLLHK